MALAESAQRFTPAQLELLRMFSRDIPDEQWVELRKIIAQYFMQKATEMSDKVTEHWTEEDYYKLLHTHDRIPYNPKNQ